MNTILRYSVVATIALLAFGGPLAWAKSFSRRLADRIEQEVRDQLLADGKVEEAAQLSFGGRLQNMGIMLSSADADQLVLADTLLKLWWIWGLLIAGGSYALLISLGYFFPDAHHSMDSPASISNGESRP